MKTKKPAKNLDYIFNPSSVAVIGASRDPDSVGQSILKNLVNGCVFQNEYCKPFPGRIYPINPFADEIIGVKCYKSLKHVEDEVDLAVVCVPAKLVLGVAKDCVKKKVKGIIIISSGFAETGEEGKRLQDKITDVLRKANIPLIGPNCLGVIRPSSNLNASFAPSAPPQGNIAFISQSGALADSIIDWSIEKRYGFSAVVSYGNRADLDVHDFIQYFADDEETKAITLYIESIEDGKRFMEIARHAAKKKPIIALKAGRTEGGKKAISSHTGSLAGDYKIYEAAFRQSGIMVADTVEELFDSAKSLANQPPCRSNAVAIVTNGGGCGVLAADYCEDLGINVVELKKTTIIKLDKSGVMHPSYSRRNPLDIIGDALPERYEVAVNTLLSEPYISGLIILQTLQSMTKPLENARKVIEAHEKHAEKPVICVYMGGKFSRQSIALLEKHNIPDYNDPKKAALAMKALVERGKIVKP